MTTRIAKRPRKRLTRHQHAHRTVANVAMEAANQHYEVFMGENAIYAEWKRLNPGATPEQLRQRYVAKHWGKFVPFARATLACMLRTTTDEKMREEIYEALLLDDSLVRGRGKPVSNLTPTGA